MDVQSLPGQWAALAPDLKVALTVTGAALFLLGLLAGRLLAGRRAGSASVAERPGSEAQAAVEVRAADFPGMTDSQARRLSAGGIGTAQALWERARDPAALAALAAELGLEDFVVARWVNSADLQRVAGVTAAEAQVLILAGVRSSKALAEANADRVQNKIEALNEQQSQLETTPSRATVVAWIEAAATL